MKRHFDVALLLFLVIGCSHDQQHGPRLRVMTYNIHHCAGVDGKLDINRIATIIKDANADLVALQEVDNAVKRSGRLDQAAELGRATGFNPVFGKAVDWDGGDYGQAILSKFPTPIESHKVYKLPVTGGREPRIALAVRVTPSKPITPITFITVHLEHQHEGDRLAQARRLKEVLDQIPTKNVIVAGDFNAMPESDALKVFSDAGWKNASGDDKTFPASLPVRKIDWVWLPKESPWKVVNNDVIAERVASDHRPVVVELEWKP
jgi:endonuclease/exonuclease/phosphatase family metal-dependent hydrolase